MTEWINNSVAQQEQQAIQTNNPAVTSQHGYKPGKYIKKLI
jgi:hypothetical protein